MAKILRTSQNVITYRVNRLIKENIISGFFTIVDIELLGSVFYTLLLKINAEQEHKRIFIEYIKANHHVTVIDEFVGKWNLLIEFACKNPYHLFEFIQDIQNRFSELVNTFEMHPTLKMYTVEQLPVELVQNKDIIKQARPQKIELDSTEKKLLSELNKDSTASLLALAKKTSVTYKTVAAKIKKLKTTGVIQKFSANINLHALGYAVYLVLFDFNNLSIQMEQKLHFYLKHQQNIRTAFMSAAKPRVFIYVAVKNPTELQDFLQAFNSTFREIITNQEYLLSSDQIKYELFPNYVLN